MVAALPSTQSERLKALRLYDILDTPTESGYEDITRLAAYICNSPIAVINFIDEARQWFKSEIGLGVRELPLDDSICAHAILEQDMLLVPDTLLDPRFADNPLCTSGPQLRFYAGTLLKTTEGYPLGTLCVLDYRPRVLTEDQIDGLRRLGHQVMAQLELRRSLKTLRSSEEFARGVLENSPDCVNVLDLQGRMVSINSMGRRQMEIDNLDSVLNQPWLTLWKGKDAEAAQRAVDAAKNGHRAQFEGYRATAKGQPRWWEVVVTPIMGEDGKPLQLLSISHDISARVQLEEQVRNTAKLESLGVMAGGIAHDFNNLLTGVIGNASLLIDTVGPEDREMVEEILSAAERAAFLTQQMLAYSGKGRFEIVKLSLSRKVREVLPLVQSSIEKNIQIALELDEKLPYLEADPIQLGQLITNLVRNAAEALEGKAGTIRIRTYSSRSEDLNAAESYACGGVQKAHYAVLEVHDSGCGIGEENRDRIFDPFFTTKFTGRGLGLAAVSGIVRGHRGAIQVTTTPGMGTMFRVLLPALAAPVFERRAEPGTEMLRGHGTILVVDDEDSVRRMSQIALERFGYHILLASNGREAVEKLKDSKSIVSLVILDMVMPVMNGDEAFGPLREIRPDLPILVASGYAEREVSRRFAESDIAGFLQKPYSVMQLAQKVKAALSGASADGFGLAVVN